ncbi:hypothetical protein OSTOST_12540, partial [Ostertagia ostertagi]
MYITKKSKPASSSDLSTFPYSAALSADASDLLRQVQEIVAVKKPKGQFLHWDNFLFISLDVVEVEKKERFFGNLRLGSELAASLRQEHTEKAVMNIQDELDIEARPLQIYRMGKEDDRPIKCVSLQKILVQHTSSFEI